MRDTDVNLVLQFHCLQTSLGCGQILERSIRWHKARARPQQGLLSRPLLPIFLMYCNGQVKWLNTNIKCAQLHTRAPFIISIGCVRTLSYNVAGQWVCESCFRAPKALCTFKGPIVLITTTQKAEKQRPWQAVLIMIHDSH